VVESALRPHAGSRKNAIGFWQFMEGTGKRQGLVINDRLTSAAASSPPREGPFGISRACMESSAHGPLPSLRTTWARMGSWRPSSSKAWIITTSSISHWRRSLCLQDPHRQLILSDPARYGFQLAPEDYYPPLLTDRVEVQCSRDTPIRIVAQAAKTYFKVIKDLKPRDSRQLASCRNSYAPRSLGAAGEFQKRFSALVDEWLAAKERQIYVVKEGDTLTSIAARSRCARRSPGGNRLKPKATIRPGDKVIVSRGGIEAGEVD